MTAQELADLSWEKLPTYGHARSMSEALREGYGSCLHRSIIIGRAARRAGMYALRRISFGSDDVAYGFSNYVLVDGKYYLVRTNHAHKDSICTPEPVEFDPNRVYVSSSDGGFEPFNYDAPTSSANILAIPETQIGLYLGCVTSNGYIRQACGLYESQRAHRGPSGIYE